jgi:lipopolysaccharide transport system ATP-binding protein
MRAVKLPREAEMAESIAIRVEGLGKCYHVYDRPQDRFWQFLWRGRRHFHREFWALREVSFEVGRGETVGIIGRNGSGKSTLLQLIAGTLEPTTGQTRLRGRVAALLELGSGFNPEFTGRENVFLNASILGLSQAEIEGKYDEIVAFADIGEFIDRPVKTYSSGMIVRLAFSVSVCVEPDILIVDEALSVGDMVFQFKCMERLDQLTRSGVTLLFVSHDIAAVKAFCRRAIYLVNGEVRGIGSASDMTELYLMDMRAEQKNALTATAQVALKPALDGGGLAFGSAQGRVKAARFVDTGGTSGVFSTGERVRLEVEVEYESTVARPAVTIILYDQRMVEIGGRYFPVNSEAMAANGTNRVAAEISFPAMLNNGNYFLTLRLEDRISDTHFHPIDKQVAALSFQVMRPVQRHFLGSLPRRMPPI